jgi:diketogulonate reductase-like aldo/keto reductase
MIYKIRRNNMSLIKEWVRLNNGFKMPKLGFGTYGIDKSRIKNIILDALSVGYRHLETAPIYLNEKEIGQAIKESKIPRESLFITSKIPPHIKNYDSAIGVVNRSLKTMGLDYLDAILINNPVPWGKEGEDFTQENRDVYRALEDLYDKEKVTAIGISNFTIADMEALLPFVRIKPQIHQLGIYIGHTLDDIRAFSENQGMVIQGHSVLVRGRIFKMDELKSLAKKSFLTPAQISIRYVVEKNVYPIVKTDNKDRMIENINIDQPLNYSAIKSLDQIDEDLKDYLPPNAKWVL